MSYSEIELAGLRLQAETGLSARELNEMSMDEFARILGRPTFAESAIAALQAQGETPGTVTPGEAAAHEESPVPVPDAGPGIDISSLSLSEYSQIRQQLGMGQSRQEGVGLLNQSSSQAWADAARRQPGRSGWQGSNVEAPPDMTRQQLPTRPVEGRYSPYKGA